MCVRGARAEKTSRDMAEFQRWVASRKVFIPIKEIVQTWDAAEAFEALTDEFIKDESDTMGFTLPMKAAFGAMRQALNRPHSACDGGDECA